MEIVREWRWRSRAAGVSDLREDASRIVGFGPQPDDWFFSPDLSKLWLITGPRLVIVELGDEPEIVNHPWIATRLIVKLKIGDGIHTIHGWEQTTAWSFSDREAADLRLDVSGIVVQRNSGTGIDRGEAFARRRAVEAGWTFADGVVELDTN
jgi:hypothetical protein